MVWWREKLLPLGEPDKLAWLAEEMQPQDLTEGKIKGQSLKIRTAIQQRCCLPKEFKKETNKGFQ